MIAHKLFRLRKDGTLGPLFINKRQVIKENEWLDAENHPTRGFKVRPGWHVTKEPTAPHLSKAGRVWRVVEIEDYIEIQRPESQGGTWYIANKMKVL